MPELPEVETIRRQLEERVRGLKIEDVKVTKPRLFIGDPKDLIGLKVQGVRRRAKLLIIDLEPKVHLRGGLWLHLLIHLKMTGQLIYRKGQPACRQAGFGGGHPVPPFEAPVPNKYTYITFDLSDGSTLYYNDLRQFGWIKIVTSDKLKKELAGFGPEPLSKDFSIEQLKSNLLKHKRLKIKPTLMDQSVVAGLGNIYAAEACFQAGLRPDRKIETLSDKDFQNLYSAIKKVLPLAIKYKGTSADAYVTLEGKKGGYASKLWVYGREGELCPKKCGGKVKKVMMAGRGTYFCSNCQH